MTPRDVLAEARFFYVNSTYAYIRTAPALKNENVIDKLPKNTRVKGLMEKGNWYKVQLEDGRVGWMSKQVLVPYRIEERGRNSQPPPPRKETPDYYRNDEEAIGYSRKAEEVLHPRVLEAITNWQNGPGRGLGITKGVKKIIVEQYISAVENCRTGLRSIQMEDVKFYVSRYLDQARQGRAYSPEIICNPSGESPLKRNEYGRLRIVSDFGRSIAIDDEFFDGRLKDFLLTIDNVHRVTIDLESGKRCDQTVRIRSGESSVQISCTRL
jgi:hypothetical protein